MRALTITFNDWRIDIQTKLNDVVNVRRGTKKYIKNVF